MSEIAIDDMRAFREALDQHAIVSIADAGGNITYVNDKFCQISKYSRDELIGRNHRLLKSGMHDARFFDDLWLTISSGRTWQGEVCNRSKDGGLYWVETTIVPGLDENGLPCRYVSMRTEITRIKQAEAALAQSKAELEMRVRSRTVELEQTKHKLEVDALARKQLINKLVYFKSVLDQSQEAIFIFDADSLRMIYLNHSAETGLGFGKDELMQMPLPQLDERMSYLASAEMVASLRANGNEDIALDTEYQRKDGGRFPVELILKLVTGNDGKQVLITVVRNIVGRKDAYQDQRKNYEAMQTLNRELEEAQNHLMQSDKMASIGQLAAGVAHEINNPIGYVYSNLGTLEKYVQDTFAMLAMYEQAEGSIADAEVREKLKAARDKLDIAFLKEDLSALMNESKDGITRVKQIVQNLKDFSHVDATDEWQYADLHQGLDSTLNIVSNEIKYKADVVREYGDLPEVECLSSQLNQVFMNLLVNASHAIEERGTVTIRTGRQGDEVWVEIADSGKGIAPEHLKKIFDPFFTTKPIGKGTGLGLSLSYGILQKHHGRIEVESEVGKGTTFRVWLPVRQPVLA
ncbi:MAG: PAS domain S-box protein [Proteobacteria bacterium]|nr:PAS domain S-box protein [Pseudomonadota bacterium]